MPTTNLNVAILGCGYVSNDHIKAWKRVHQAQLVAVCDVSEMAAKKMSEFWKIPRYFTSFPKLLEQKNIEIIDICTPPHTHASLAVQAMQSNFNVLLEKPMTMTSKDADEIVQCQKTTGMKAGVIHNWLFEPPVREATALVKKGGIGEVVNVEIEALNTKYDSMTANEKHWCHTFPGGRFSEMLAHPVYLLRHYLGSEISIGDVQVAKIGEYPWMKSDELCATFHVGTKLGRSYASFNMPRAAIFISLYGKKAIIRLDIVNATLNILPARKTSRFNKAFDSLRQAGQLTRSTAKNIMKITSKRWSSGHDFYIRSFAECVLTDKEPPVTVEEGYHVVKIVEQMCGAIDKAERER
jgi:predicted dehydrogenase